MSVYEEIQANIGMTEFKNLAERLMQVAENRKRLHGIEIPLPNYIFVADPGCGVSTSLDQLTRLLRENGLFRFAGERPFFEWMLGKPGSEWSVERLLDRIRTMAGFHNRFRGVIGLEMEKWTDAEMKDPDFQKLLDLVDDKRNEILFVFVLPARTDDELNDMINAIRMAAPAEIIHFASPTEEEMAEYLKVFLNRKGFGISNQAFRELPGMMKKLRESPQFEGLGTLDDLADEIIYRVCSGGRINETTILSDDLDFIREQRFLTRTRHAKNHTRRIGFGG